MIRGCQTSMGNLRKCKKYCRKKNSGIPHSGCLKKNCMNTDTTPIGVFLMQSIMEYHRNRERVYLILIQKEMDNGTFQFPEPLESFQCLMDILEDTVEEKILLIPGKSYAA